MATGVGHIGQVPGVRIQFSYRREIESGRKRHSENSLEPGEFYEISPEADGRNGFSHDLSVPGARVAHKLLRRTEITRLLTKQL